MCIQFKARPDISDLCAGDGKGKEIAFFVSPVFLQRVACCMKGTVMLIAGHIRSTIHLRARMINFLLEPTVQFSKGIISFQDGKSARGSYAEHLCICLDSSSPWMSAPLGRGQSTGQATWGHVCFQGQRPSREAPTSKPNGMRHMAWFRR